MNSDQIMFLHAASERQHNINPTFIKITGSITYGYLLTQLMFLFRAYNFKEFYKTEKYMMEHFLFSEWELRKGREILKGLGILETRRGQPKQLFYNINVTKLMKLYKQNCFTSEESSPGYRGNLASTTEETSPVLKVNNDLVRMNKNNNKDKVVVCEKLMKSGLDKRFLVDMLKKYGEEKLNEKIDLMNKNPERVVTPEAWITDALLKDYKAAKEIATINHNKALEEESKLKIEALDAHNSKPKDRQKAKEEIMKSRKALGRRVS